MFEVRYVRYIKLDGGLILIRLVMNTVLKKTIWKFFIKMPKKILSSMVNFFSVCRLMPWSILWTTSYYDLSIRLRNQQSDMCPQQRLRSAWASTKTGQMSLLYAWKSFGHYLPILSIQRRLINMGRCPGSSESLLGVHAKLLCHAADVLFLVAMA